MRTIAGKYEDEKQALAKKLKNPELVVLRPSYMRELYTLSRIILKLLNARIAVFRWCSQSLTTTSTLIESAACERFSYAGNRTRIDHAQTSGAELVGRPPTCAYNYVAT